MRKIIPLIALILLSAMFTKAQNVNQADATLALQLVDANKAVIGITAEEIANLKVLSTYEDRTVGIRYVYLQQSYKDRLVYNQMLVLAFKASKLISKAGGFLTNMQSLTNGGSATPTVTPVDAVRTSITESKVDMPASIIAINTTENGKIYDFGKLNIARENVTAELMWLPIDDGIKITSAKLVWQVQLFPVKNSDYWNIRVDANSNTVINKSNLTVYEKFGDVKHDKSFAGDMNNFVMANNNLQKASTNTNNISNIPQLLQSPSLVGTANYTVIPYPAESPIHAGGTAAVRTNPWTLAGGNAVSLGWHNDGTLDYTTSRGNNVYAQEDRDNNNATFGLTANSTTTPDPLNFTYAGQPNYTVAPTTAGFQQFALTNLFYWNNLCHDLTYNHGFTEPARNFQNDNQGRGGTGGDYVIADGQDAGGLNNANMSTPPDGTRPRMQMYLWDPTRSTTTMIVNSPPVIAGPYTAVEGAMSPNNLLATVGPVTNQVVWYNDDAPGNTHYACNAPANSVAGKIALIVRGFGGAVCTATVPFTVKVKNAQDAGAVAVIMVNNVPGAPIVMGATTPDPTIIIPAVMISDVDGATIAAQLASNVNVTLSGTAPGTIQLDGDIDNGIIAHEFFHGVSNRLTGGAVTCLQNAEQAGEGWSDYLALMMTTNWATATAADGNNISRPIGNYAFGYPTTGPGIRQYPYRTNIAVNPLTYANLPTQVIPHGVGTVFCTALWEMTWEIIQSRGISANLFNASLTGGNVVAFRIMMEGLKLQPCSPGFIDARNAIIQADINLYGGADVCAIWRAFAKRGMGFSALQGSSNSIGDQTPAFDLPPACLTATPPTVTINQAAAQPDPTSVSPINFTVVFDQPVTGFATGDVVLTGTAGALLGTVTGSGANYNVAVSGMTSCGTVIATIPAGVCQNASAQNNVASTSTDNTVTYNLAPPNVTINQAGAQPDPTGATPILFTAVFDQAVTGFATGDVTLSGTAGANSAVVSGGPTTYTITVSGMTGSGTVTPTIAAGVCQNACAQTNTASTSTDNTVTYNAPFVCTDVLPVPNQTVCHLSSTAAVNFTSTIPGTVFSWVNNTTSIGLGASGNGNIPSFVGTNPTTAPVTATITVTPTLTTVTPTTTTFNFTGGAQTFTVPAGVTSLNITTLGAQGGSGATGGNGATGGVGGNGSRATGTLAVTPGQVLTIFVGGTGGAPTAGFNGGGTGGNANSGGGGGASDVRFPGASSADRILVAGGGGGGGRAGCEPNTVNGGAGGIGDGNGANGVTSPNGGGGFGAIGVVPGAAGIGCAGFLGNPGLAGFGPAGGNGGGGQTCCCFTFASVPGGGGGGGGFLGGAGGGGGSAGTTGCLGNDKGGGGGGSGGISYTGGVTAGVVTTNIQTGNGQVVLNYNVTVVCNGPTMAFTITVNPTPAVDPIPNQVVCQNAPTAPVNFTGTPVGVVFQWTNNTPAIGLAAAGTGNIPSFIAQNPTALPLVATITVTPATGLATPIVTTYNFTGAVQTFTVPAGITLVNLKSWGAQGNSNAGGIVGGRGGYAEGNLAVTPGQVLNVMVGGGATTTTNGGFNGGGAAGLNGGCAAAQGGGGGGASDVRISPYALANRVIVGAGGGGAGGNRTAGCGRGTGGGGGGGLWGGGGGAGWPGVPPGGPVPTGGTQVAGGAGGVTTWTAGGPTNGFPGVLGIGGAGGIEVGSAQGTPTGPAEQGGVGGGLTGGSGLYNSANNWNGHSGAGGSSYIGGVSGGITTAGLRTGAGQVQITYTPISAATCFGVARTFTITVNPNANLIIVADPGTTICEGDPTLLTVYDAGAVTAPGVLYTQGTTPVNGSPSQVFEPANAAFTSQGADNFTIPAGGLWTVTQITANGIGAGVPTSVNVFFYANSGANLPGAAISSQLNITTFVKVGGNYTVTLPTPLALGAGTYWMSFQVNMSFATGGQWFWGNFGAANINLEYAWQNPGGGFATPCTAWGYGGTGCNVGGGAANRNNIFSIIGTNVGLGPQSTGTFLWSPALGLSSTTSNPVAASPMNTTTYTVVRTTVPGGCQASAQVTITVNKRPVVTTQPANVVRCVGTTATFTVGGTGTGLTYQWQVSTAGCAGPWVNLTNVAPYSGVTTATLTVNPVTQLMSGYAYRCVLGGTCTPFIPPTNVSNCATLSVNPNPVVTITPAGPVCGGVAGISGTQLSTASTPPPVPGSVTVNSGAISIPVPDNNPAGVSSNLTVAGIPANATVTGVRATWTMPHTWNGDMVFVLRSPNGSILNLDYFLSATGGAGATTGFVNTTVSSAGTAAISTGTGTYTGTFRADATMATIPPFGPPGPTGFTPTVATWTPMYTPIPNGTWTLAMYDGGAIDLGTLTNWSVTVDYTTPGTTGSTLSYVWSPVAGLYTDPTAVTPYTGQNLSTVYAAPTVQTLYTVTATDATTGCFSTASVLVNYTPPAPTVTPSSVTMCLGDPAVRLIASSSSTTTTTYTSGTISVPIPEGTFPTGPYVAGTSTIPVAGIPVGAAISRINVRMNITHAFVGDVVAVLQAPNGQRINLDALLNATNNPGANFVNTVISSAGVTALSAGTAPWTNTFRADAVGATFTIFGFPLPGGPVGYIPTTTTWPPLYGTPNGNWTLALYDAGAPDIGTLTNWSMDISYVVGVVATPAVWSPAAGLFNDAAASSPYVLGTPRDTVWTRPTPSGVYTYTATVNNVISSGSVIPLPPHVSTFTGNVRGYWFTAPSAFTMTSVEVPTSASAGAQSIAVLRFNGAVPPPAFPGTTNAFTTLFLTQNNPAAGAIPVNIPVNAGDVIGILGYRATVNSYTANPPNTTVINGTTVNLTRMGMQFPLTTTAPQQIWQEAAFQISRVFFSTAITGPGTCQSPPRTVVVTVNDPTVLNVNLPANQTICTDKVATFSVSVTAGTGPHSYQWQVSTNGGGTWTNVANGGVYSGATTATLTITAPPVSMSGYQYRAIVTGAAPCAAQTSRVATLTVNPLPVIVISTNRTSLLPGLTATLTSTVAPNPVAPGGYSWIRNGGVLSSSSLGVVSGIGTGSIVVDVDGMGDYQLRVTDVNGCTSISNTITIKDSASGKCFIYPNPTSGKFQVRYYSVANNVLPRTMTVYDSKGDRMITQFYTIGRPYDRMDVDMRAFGKGLYWVEIGDRNGNRLVVCRVVIQ